MAHDEKSLLSVFQELFATIDKAFILAGGLGTRLLSRGFRHFPGIF